MTFRFSAVSLLAASTLALVACGDSTEKDTDQDTNPPVTDTDTGETGEPVDPGPQRLRHLTISAHIGFDADANVAAPVDFDGTLQSSMLFVDLGVEGWNGDTSLTDQYCSVVMILDGLEPQDWALAEGRWVGLDFAEGETFHSCDDFDYIGSFGEEPDTWFTVGVLWRLGIGGDLESSIADVIPESELPYMFGGSISATLPEYDNAVFLDTDVVYAYGYEVDQNMAVVADNDGYLIPLQALDVPQGTSMRSGYYVWTAGLIWTLTAE